METLNPNPNPPVVDGPDAMLLHHRGHLRHAFDVESTSDAKTDAKTRTQKTTVTAYYPLQFDALRGASIADGDEGFAASLSAVAKWDGGAKGGKSGSLFGKTRDDLSPTRRYYVLLTLFRLPDQPLIRHLHQTIRALRKPTTLLTGTHRSMLILG